MWPEVYEYVLGKMQPDEVKQKLDEIKASLQRSLRVKFDQTAVEPEISFPFQGRNDYDGPVARLLPGSKALLKGAIPANAKSFSFRASKIYGQVVLIIHPPGSGEPIQEVLNPGTDSAPFPLDLDQIVPHRLTTALQYLRLGYEHILPQGLDHILFVIGLFLLSASLRPLLLQVTAFTLAHTLTLALSMYGIVSLSPRIVEPLIAVSIAFVAIENIFTGELKPWRPFVVFGFGLLHGLGFAGALGALGLPRSQFLTALLSFNAGVELGQLSVILIMFLAVGWFRHRAWYRRRMVIPFSAAIALVALYWAWERTFV
jgi:hypothetical protein